jgi:hypothetical protein
VMSGRVTHRAAAAAAAGTAGPDSAGPIHEDASGGSVEPEMAYLTERTVKPDGRRVIFFRWPAPGVNPSTPPRRRARPGPADTA